MRSERDAEVLRVENEIESLTKAGHNIHLTCFSFASDCLPLEIKGNLIDLI